MPQINSEILKEYLATGGKIAGNLALKFYGDSINEAGNKAFGDALEIGITNTIAALYEANVEDNDIVNLLNKHWGISRNEAIDRLVFEKKQAPLREVREYLQMQGLSSQEIHHFMFSKKIAQRLMENPELRELRRTPGELIKTIEKLEDSR